MKITDLKQLEPCENGYKFAQSKNSLIDAWETCERGDWMLWFAQKLNCPLQLLTLAKGRCAETVIHLMRDERSRKAVEVAIDFGNGVATREELYAAACAADAAKTAAYAASDYAAEYAAKIAANAASDYEADAAAAYAADAAADAAAADYTDAYAADPAASDCTADDAAAADAARKENQALTANIC